MAHLETKLNLINFWAERTIRSACFQGRCNMTHTQEEVQLKDRFMGFYNGIQYKHKEWTFSHQNLSPQKYFLSDIYTEANRDQMHESINKFD